MAFSEIAWAPPAASCSKATAFTSSRTCSRNRSRIELRRCPVVITGLPLEGPASLTRTLAPHAILDILIVRQRVSVQLDLLTTQITALTHREERRSDEQRNRAPPGGRPPAGTARSCDGQPGDGHVPGHPRLLDGQPRRADDPR